MDIYICGRQVYQTHPKYIAKIQRLEGTIRGLINTGKQTEAALKDRAADADRLRAQIRDQNAAFRRMQQDRRSDRQKQSDLLSFIDCLKEQLTVNERIVVELSNDREAIGCLERAVPDIVLDSMLGSGVRTRQSGQN